MRYSLRCVGGPKHGTSYVFPDPQFMVSMFSSETPTAAWEADSTPVDMDVIRYERVHIRIPMRAPSGHQWEYHEDVWVPSWMSEESAMKALLDLGLLGVT